MRSKYRESRRRYKRRFAGLQYRRNTAHNMHCRQEEILHPWRRLSPVLGKIGAGIREVEVLDRTRELDVAVLVVDQKGLLQLERKLAVEDVDTPPDTASHLLIDSMRVCRRGFQMQAQILRDANRAAEPGRSGGFEVRFVEEDADEEGSAHMVERVLVDPKIDQAARDVDVFFAFVGALNAGLGAVENAEGEDGEEEGRPDRGFVV